MSVPSPVHVSLHLEPTDGTIGGQMTIDNEPASEFYGWLRFDQPAYPPQVPAALSSGG
jgi:hypothetical protein